jgi:hypothetical protein
LALVETEAHLVVPQPTEVIRYLVLAHLPAAVLAAVELLLKAAMVVQVAVVKE